MKSRVSPQKLRKWAVNTNLGILGLDLHSNSPQPVNFFGAQSLLGGAQFSFGGHKQSFGRARPWNAPPRGAGPGVKVVWLVVFGKFDT